MAELFRLVKYYFIYPDWYSGIDQSPKSPIDGLLCKYEDIWWMLYYMLYSIHYMVYNTINMFNVFNWYTILCIYIYTYVVLCVVFTQMECINQETHHWGIPATPGRTCPPATCRAAASRSFSSTTRAIYRVRDDRFAGDGWESSFPVFSQGESMRKCYNISITNDSGSGYNWL